MGLFHTYNKVRHIFNRPKIRMYFGLWKNDPGLPVCRNKLFYFCNHDVIWKSKWDECRYEFPPQFTIVLFGIAFTLTLHCPSDHDYCCDDNYWEAILTYLCCKDSLKIVIINQGYYTNLNDNIKYFSVRPEYIRDDHLDEYCEAIESIKLQDKNII